MNLATTLSTVAVATALLAGCGSAFNTQVSPVADAPPFPPAETSSIVPAPPPNAVHLAKIEEQGSKDRNADDCTRRLQVDARKLGATFVVVGAKTEPVADKGPTCSGEAYVVPKTE
jgi:hypothetical protein